MERPNQPPEAECCRGEGKAPSPMEGGQGRTTPWKRTQAETQAASASRTALKQYSLENTLNADGDGVTLPEPKTFETNKGEVSKGLPGSIERGERRGISQELGTSLSFPEVLTIENQPGRQAQRKQEQPKDSKEIRLAHSSQGQEEPKAFPTLAKGPTEQREPSKETSSARTAEVSWPTSLKAIATKADKDKQHRFGGLYRLLNQANLKECFFSLHKQAAPGVDRVTFRDYEVNLEENLADLVERLKHKSYRARLVKRHYIPKGNTGKLRPLGIPVLEEKLVQQAVSQILSAIYEADFVKQSYGYRPGKSPHDAVKDLTDTLQFGKFEFVVEADIKSFFDHIQHEALLGMLSERVDDQAFLGLIRKWLKAGILETDGKVIHPQTGTPQGGVVSPVLANVYLHCVLDWWFVQEIQGKNQGQSELFRFADDFVAAFQYRHEAEAFERKLRERLKEFGLEVAPEKTKTLRFGRGGGPYNGRFDFLGFEFRWDRSRQGKPVVGRRTARKKLRASLENFTTWVREARDWKMNQVMENLTAKYRGYWNYYGVIGNSKSLRQFYYLSVRVLFKWLNRRSQRKSYTWTEFNQVLHYYRIPPPKVWEKMPGQSESARPKVKRVPIAEVNLFGKHYRPARA